jgi:hypothetical protein
VLGKNVVQIQVLIAAILIKLAVKALVANLTSSAATTNAAKTGNAVSMATVLTLYVTIATIWHRYGFMNVDI